MLLLLLRAVVIFLQTLHLMYSVKGTPADKQPPLLAQNDDSPRTLTAMEVGGGGLAGWLTCG